MLKSPFKLCLWIADRCNLSCKYCYARPFSGRMMDSNRMLALIDELADLEVFDLIYAGGEPFLHPNLFDFIDRTLEKGMRTTILTNGVSLDERTRQNLDARYGGNYRFLLQVSLDSPNPRINDVVRGEGETILRNILDWKKTKVSIQVAVVLTKYNIESAHSIIERLYPVVKCYHFMQVQRTFSSLDDPNAFVSGEEAKRFWLKLRDFAASYPPDLLLPSLRIALRSNRESDGDETALRSSEAVFRPGVCKAGHSTAHIDADFNLLGCDIAKQHAFMGNVRERSFAEVWNSERAQQMRDSPFPLCYKIESADGRSLQTCLRPEYRKESVAAIS